MTALHFAVLSALPAIALSWAYLLELSRLISKLKQTTPDLWLQLGSPAFGSAGAPFLAYLIRGRLERDSSLSAQARRQARRLRIYLLVGIPLWLAILVVIALRRQLDLSL